MAKALPVLQVFGPKDSGIGSDRAVQDHRIPPGQPMLALQTDGAQDIRVASPVNCPGAERTNSRLSFFTSHMQFSNGHCVEFGEHLCAECARATRPYISQEVNRCRMSCSGVPVVGVDEDV